jgi:glycosyltransferase involved in cell wall biosynthesis
MANSTGHGGKTNTRIVLLRSNPVDPDSRVEKEVNSLTGAGYEVEILAWDRDGDYQINDAYLYLESGKVKIHRFGIPAAFDGGIKNNLIPLIKFNYRVYSWLCKNMNNYDIIHACDFDTAFIASLAAGRFKKKFVYDIFDYYIDAFNVPGFLKKTIEKMDHRIINTADGVIICTEQRKEQIKGTRPRRLVVIHNAPAGLKEIKKLALDESKIKIVYVGVLIEGRFIEEISEAVKNNPVYEFHVGGFGKLESYLREMSRKYDNIIFYGKLSYKETLELENSCDIMAAIYDPAVPNHYYAAPNKFYEALMLGKPLIMARNTGMSKIVEREGIGELIDFTRSSFSRALALLAERKQEWPVIGAKMKKIYKEHYSWDEMEKRLLNLYKEVPDTNLSTY